MSDTQIYRPQQATDRTFGKYKVIKELGRGAMGVVYECFDPDFERSVAIKILSPDLLKLDTTGEYRQRFRNEMKAAGRLAHPHVISVFDAGEQEGIPYFVMEFVDGYELKQVLDDGRRFEQKEVIRIMREVLSGLKYIHAHNIIHRDLKPANIFITSEGAAKITDFGIAKLESSELTRVGTIIGSPRYMSPEQCQGLPVDARSDLFAAGIIFYQLLTNEHCFEANSPTAIMQKIIHKAPEPPSLLIPTLNKVFDQVISTALEKSPDKRYQTAEAFLEALDDAVAGRAAPSTDSQKRIIPLVLASSIAVAIGAGSVFMATQFIGGESEQIGQTSNDGTGAGQSKTGDQANSIIAGGDTNNTNIEKDKSSGGASGTVSVNPNSTTGEQIGGTSSAETEINKPQLTPEQADKVKRILKVAKVHQLQGRLISPSGSSAYDAYQIVLEIDPKNNKAQTGLDNLESLLIKRIAKLAGDGNQALAKTEAENGAKLFPHNPTLQKLSKTF